MLLLEIDQTLEKSGSRRQPDKVDEMMADHDPEAVPRWVAHLPSN